MPNGHLFKCTLCEKAEYWSTKEAAEAAATWHVYDDHPESWIEAAGSPREPEDDHPLLLGTRRA